MMNTIFLFKILLFINSCSTFTSGDSYKIKKSETPLSLAVTWNVPLCAIREANVGHSFAVGTWIKLPRSIGGLGQMKDCGETEINIKKGFIWPLGKRKKISSKFGKRWGRHHRGVDIPAPLGTPILAAKGGRVIFSGYNFGGFGNITKILHVDGTVSLYGHAKKNFVKKGKIVRKGQIIAEVGRSGNATGPHLHFEIWKKGKARNPLNFLSEKF